MIWCGSRARRLARKVLGGWSRLRRRPRHYRRLLLQSVLLLPAIAAALRCGRLQTVQRGLARLCPPRPANAPLPDGAAGQPPEDVALVCRAVRGAAWLYGGRYKCLPQSLLLWWLLRRRGYPCELRLGVRHTERQFEAHAWVEYGDFRLEAEPIAAGFTAFDRPIDPGLGRPAG